MTEKDTDTEDGYYEPTVSDERNTFMSCISGSYAKIIKKLLATIGTEEAEYAIRHIDKGIKAAKRQEYGSLYRPSCKLSPSEIVNGEIAGLLGALKFYASLYEPNTANVMLAAHELILRLLQRVRYISIEMHRANSEAREAELLVAEYQKDRF